MATYLSAPHGMCFFSYNATDPAVTRLVADAAGRLRRIGLEVWNYTEDAKGSTRKMDSMHESISAASSVAYFIGPKGPGNLQQGQELDWAMEAEARGARLFLVLLRGHSQTDIPAKLGNPKRTPLVAEDLDDGHLSSTGFRKLCSGILDSTAVQAGEWIRARERELFLSPPLRARALLVGNCEYDDDNLLNLESPALDIEELGKTLKSLQLQGGVTWEVSPLPDPSRDDLLAKLKALFLEDARPDDLLLFYFSGHGTTESGSSYILPRNGLAAMPDASGGVRAETIRNYLKLTPAWASIVILDCCHGDTPSGPSAGNYQDLPARCSVLGASEGQTGAAGDDGLSPFTSALIGILSEEEPLPMAGLEARLKTSHATSWAQVGSLGQVERVTLGRATAPRVAEALRYTERIVVGASPAETRHLELLGRLTQTLDALLSTTPERSAELDTVIRESFRVVVEEMRRLVSRSSTPELSWSDLNQMYPRPLLEIAFAPKETAGYSPLPWEYLGVPIGATLDWLVPSRICRVVPVPATKSPTGKPQSPLVVSAAPALWGPGLREFTQLETEWLRPGRFVADFSAGILSKAKPDLLALQCALSPSGDPLIVTEVPVSYLVALINPLPVRVLVLETVSDLSNPCAGASLRRIAYGLAQSTRRSVVAVCQQTRYVTRLNQLVEAGMAETTDGPKYSFVATLVHSLMANEKLEEAAYNAREKVVGQLGPEAGSYVGLPVVVRAEPPQTVSLSQRSTPAQSSQQTQEGGSPVPSMHSEFVS